MPSLAYSQATWEETRGLGMRLVHAYTQQFLCIRFSNSFASVCVFICVCVCVFVCWQWKSTAFTDFIIDANWDVSVPDTTQLSGSFHQYFQLCTSYDQYVGSTLSNSPRAHDDIVIAAWMMSSCALDSHMVVRPFLLMHRHQQTTQG